MSIISEMKTSRFVRLECEKAAGKSLKSKIIGRQAVVHAMNAGREMTKIKLWAALKGVRWAEYCHKHFGISNATARSYMLISKAFLRPDGIPDGIHSIRSAVKVARCVKDGAIQGRLQPGWQSMEKIMVGRICWRWTRGSDDPLGLKEDIGDGWEFWGRETTCNRVNASGTESVGACDILLKRSNALEWLIVEVKSQMRTGLKELEQLLDYMRSFRLRGCGKVFGVLVCENPSRGLAAAARRASVIVRICSLTFQK